MTTTTAAPSAAQPPPHEDHPPLTPAEQATVAAVIVALVGTGALVIGAPSAPLVAALGSLIDPVLEGLAPDIAPVGQPAVTDVLELLVPHVTVGDLPADDGTAVVHMTRTAWPRRAAHVVNAAKRAARGTTIKRERQYLQQHLDAERRRQDAARAVDEAARVHGNVLGWRAVLDSLTTPECRAAHGMNFAAVPPPLIGYPGTLHGGTCRCRPVAPWPDGAMLV